MKTRTKVFYKIINIVTLAVPVPLYLILLLTAFSVKPDYKIENIEIGDLNVVTREDDYFITTNDKNAVYNGIIVFNEELDTYGLVVSVDDVIKVDKKLYNIKEDVLKEINVKEIKKEEKYSLGVPVIVSIISLLIVTLIISGKMQWQKKHPKIAVLLSLGLGTIVLKFINMIVENMYNVFLIALISWALFLIEDGIYQSQEKAIKQRLEAERLLKTVVKRG